MVVRTGRSGGEDELAMGEGERKVMRPGVCDENKKCESSGSLVFKGVVRETGILAKNQKSVVVWVGI